MEQYRCCSGNCCICSPGEHLLPSHLIVIDAEVDCVMLSLCMEDAHMAWCGAGCDMQLNRLLHCAVVLDCGESGSIVRPRLEHCADAKL